MADPARDSGRESGSLMRGLVIAAGLMGVWWVIVRAFGIPRYILPDPVAVLARLWTSRSLLTSDALVTLSEIVLGMACGVVLGVSCALAMALSPRARGWILPVIVASQAVPVFAIAPILVLWLGYGLASKVAMAALIVFFPVAATFHDGLRRTPRELLDVAAVAMARPGQRPGMADRIRLLRTVRIPAALPALASGLRVAAASAPIGAIVGEWIGSDGGLGQRMLQANARVQTDLMFAALLVLIVVAVAFHAVIDRILRRLLPWAEDGARG